MDPSLQPQKISHYRSETFFEPSPHQLEHQKQQLHHHQQQQQQIKNFSATAEAARVARVATTTCTYHTDQEDHEYYEYDGDGDDDATPSIYPSLSSPTPPPPALPTDAAIQGNDGRGSGSGSGSGTKMTSLRAAFRPPTPAGDRLSTETAVPSYAAASRGGLPQIDIGTLVQASPLQPSTPYDHTYNDGSEDDSHEGSFHENLHDEDCNDDDVSEVSLASAFGKDSHNYVRQHHLQRSAALSSLSCYWGFVPLSFSQSSLSLGPNATATTTTATSTTTTSTTTTTCNAGGPCSPRPTLKRPWVSRPIYPLGPSATETAAAPQSQPPLQRVSALTAVSPRHSQHCYWTIQVLDEKHEPGDTLWFKVFPTGNWYDQHPNSHHHHNIQPPPQQPLYLEDNEVLDHVMHLLNQDAKLAASGPLLLPESAAAFVVHWTADRRGWIISRREILHVLQVILHHARALPSRRRMSSAGDGGACLGEWRSSSGGGGGGGGGYKGLTISTNNQETMILSSPWSSLQPHTPTAAPRLVPCQQGISSHHHQDHDAHAYHHHYHHPGNPPPKRSTGSPFSFDHVGTGTTAAAAAASSHHQQHQPPPQQYPGRDWESFSSHWVRDLGLHLELTRDQSDL